MVKLSRNERNILEYLLGRELCRYQDLKIDGLNQLEAMFRRNLVDVYINNTNSKVWPKSDFSGVEITISREGQRALDREQLPPRREDRLDEQPVDSEIVQSAKIPAPEWPSD